MTYFIYLIQSIDNNRSYIGYTNNIRARWIDHRCSKRNSPLHNSIKKYGSGRHIFSILEEFSDKYIALEAEVWWIAYLKSIGAQLFNLTPGGEVGTFKGKKHSDATKRKLSNIKTGTKHSLETLERMSQIRTGRSLSEMHKLSISNGLKGKKTKEETKNKLREINKGKKLSDDTKYKISKSLTGRKHSKETLEKMRMSALNRKKGI